jgi:hypothetical protein
MVDLEKRVEEIPPFIGIKSNLLSKKRRCNIWYNVKKQAIKDE